MCNRVEPSLLSLAWTPDPQRGQKHDWCFKLLEQTNEKWHDPTAHTARPNMLFPWHLLLFMSSSMLTCLTVFYLLLLERRPWIWMSAWVQHSQGAQFSDKHPNCQCWASCLFCLNPSTYYLGHKHSLHFFSLLPNLEDPNMLQVMLFWDSTQRGRDWCCMCV